MNYIPHLNLMSGAGIRANAKVLQGKGLLTISINAPVGI